MQGFIRSRDRVRRAGHEDLHARAFETAGAPAVAARHTGAELQPPVLVAGAQAAAEDADLLVAATSGGLLAPLAARYLNRDLAHMVVRGLLVRLSVRRRP